MNDKKLNYHIIAIGGNLMHSLAIALKEQGHTITGSDDEIFDPSRSQLESHGLLPESVGWDPEKITSDLDGVILGMHARKDNPELKKAQELGLPILSAPDVIYQECKNKQRVVIAGSHGKTSITAIIMHVLSYFKRDFDYIVGASVAGFKNNVRLSDAPVVIIEGDEYPSSPLDPTPKFLNYHHHIGLISGIAWDHVNVYKTEEDYVKLFDLFADATPKAGVLAYCEEDALCSMIGNKERPDVQNFPYRAHPFQVDGKHTLLVDGEERISLQILGRHNMENISGAMKVLNKLSITNEEFYEAITSFKGAYNRLTLVNESDSVSIFKDYAHAPSKVLATTRALKEQFPERDLIACLELHTFSSLNKDFLPEYAGTLKYVNQPIIYYSPDAVKHKKLEMIDVKEVEKAFDHPNLKVFTDLEDLKYFLKSLSYDNKTMVMMSSGNFGGFDLLEFSTKILNH